MTKKEEKKFNALFKAVVKHGTVMQNRNLPPKMRAGDIDAHTVVIPTYKVLKEFGKFVKEYNKKQRKVAAYIAQAMEEPDTLKNPYTHVYYNINVNQFFLGSIDYPVSKYEIYVGEL